jgi:hypothetical protein
MRVQVVHDQDNLLSLRVTHVHRVFAHVRPVDGGALVANDHFSPATQRFIQHEQGTYAVAFVLRSRSERAAPVLPAARCVFRPPVARWSRPDTLEAAAD